MSSDLSDWSPSSWHSFPAAQQPDWPDIDAYHQVLREISGLPALVFAGETRELTQELADAARGKTFVLQAGDCAEEFGSCHGPAIHDQLKVILQMAVVLTYAAQRKVVKIGRIAGQYAKPRSAATEVVDGVALPTYRGDIVNGPEATVRARTPDPARVREGYFRATAALNLIRAFTKGGYASLELAHAWSEASSHAFGGTVHYRELVEGIRRSIRFMEAIGIDRAAHPLNAVSLYTSHEALLLGFEEALTRVDTTTGRWYATSANMLWIGDRTRQPDGAHVEFLRGVGNPIGIKVGPSCEAGELLRVVERLNPDNLPGRITLIARMGAGQIDQKLPPLVTAIRGAGADVLWLCDPMHGNTYINRVGRKTRNYEDIIGEIRRFFELHGELGTVPGGLHLELTGLPVTECSGGRQGLAEEQLQANYRSTCDPRLNALQAVELAFEVATMLTR